MSRPHQLGFYSQGITGRADGSIECDQTSIARSRLCGSYLGRRQSVWGHQSPVVRYAPAVRGGDHSRGRANPRAFLSELPLRANHLAMVQLCGAHVLADREGRTGRPEPYESIALEHVQPGTASGVAHQDGNASPQPWDATAAISDAASRCQAVEGGNRFALSVVSPGKATAEAVALTDGFLNAETRRRGENLVHFDHRPLRLAEQLSVYPVLVETCFRGRVFPDSVLCVFSALSASSAVNSTSALPRPIFPS